ncbi:MAG: MlaE family lipid ABC transporter permease subunit [Phycisphaera sp.]|nr:MlaE family lipid ABC transporter permease subunit [Phycisphaera sp.]
MAFARLAYLGSVTLGTIDGIGQFTRFSFETAFWTLRGAGKWGRWRLIMPQLFNIGTRSIPVVILVGAFVGMVLAVEAYRQFAMMGVESRLGGIIDVSVVRQIGPVLAAVMIAGRVGGAVSAELGTMRVTEQIDAMRVMGTDPVAYLVVPRLLACLLMLPILTILSNLVGIAGGYLICTKGYGINGHEYRMFSNMFVSNYDVMSGLVKSVFFGLSIGLISTYKGFYCRSGAAGVGRAATEAFVTSFIAIIVLNLFLAKFLNDMYYVFYGYDRAMSAMG